MSINNEGVKTLAQAAQGGGRWPIPGDVQSQAGWGSEKPALVEGVCSWQGMRTRGPLQGPFQLKLLCGSVT